MGISGSFALHAFFLIGAVQRYASASGSSFATSSQKHFFLASSNSEDVEKAAGNSASKPVSAPPPVENMLSFARQTLKNLPKVGSWRCPHGAPWTDSARFTQASLLSISPNLSRDDIRAVIREAQVTGQVVLLRPDPVVMARTPGFKEFIKAAGDFDLASEDELDSFSIYDAQDAGWAGMRDLTEKEFNTLRQVLGDLKLKSYAETVQAGKLGRSVLENPIAKGMSSLGQAFLQLSVAQSLVRNSSLLLPSEEDQDPKRAPHQVLMNNLEKSGHFDALGQYPLHPGDFAEYAQLFIQGAGNVGAAHVDDDQGATYFYLRVLEGHKQMRIWPIFEEKILDNWQCAQNQWENKKVDSTLAYRAFRFKNHRWTPKGFEWLHHLKKEVKCPNNQPLAEGREGGEADSVSTPVGNTSRVSLSEVSNRDKDNDSHDASTEAQQQYTCHLELDLRTGDEVFVASGIPHQVSTLAPTIAVTANYRFNTEWYDAKDEKVDKDHLLKMMYDFPSLRKQMKMHWFSDELPSFLAMTPKDIEDGETVQSVLHRAEAAILQGKTVFVPKLARDIKHADDFKRRPWARYWNQGHRSLAHPFLAPEQDINLVKDVLLEP